MSQAHGAKQRHMERCRYAPRNPTKAFRTTRTVSERGATQTFKRKGDLVIVTPYSKSYKVTQDGWL